MSSAVFRFGARNKGPQKEYELIIDSQVDLLGNKIEFEQIAKIAGTEEEVFNK